MRFDVSTTQIILLLIVGVGVVILAVAVPLFLFGFFVGFALGIFLNKRYPEKFKVPVFFSGGDKDKRIRELEEKVKQLEAKK